MGLAQRTAMLNGNIASAGADIASEKAVIEGLFIGVHVGGILFAFAALPWLAMVAVGAAKRRAMSRVAVVFLWVAAIGPLAGFVITGYQFGVLASFRHSRSSGLHLLRSARRAATKRMPRRPPLPSRPPLGDDDDMDLAVIIVTQVVNWPLAVLVARRAARGRAPLASWATVALLVGGAIAVWDPASTLMFSRVAVAVTNASLAMLFAVYPDGRFVPRWIIVPAAIEIALQVANVASGLALERQFWWPMHFAATWGLLIIGGQVHRYRSRSSVDERERTRWPLLAIVLMIFGFSLWSFVALGLDAVSTNRSAFWLANLLLILPGVGFAVGLLAPRLLRVDRALRWTIQWGLWATVMSALAWAVSVALARTSGRAARLAHGGDRRRDRRAGAVGRPPHSGSHRVRPPPRSAAHARGPRRSARGIRRPSHGAGRHRHDRHQFARTRRCRAA